ncbi:hypothetical protein OROMI_004875 [Orobanche minor]
MFMMNASKQASHFLPSFFPEGQFFEPFNPNLDIEAKPYLVDEKGLRLVKEPPNSERKGVLKPNSPEPDFGWYLITDGIDDLSPSSPVESSPILSPSDADDSDSEWKWRKCYGDEIDYQKLLVKWEAEMFRRKTRGCGLSSIFTMIFSKVRYVLQSILTYLAVFIKNKFEAFVNFFACENKGKKIEYVCS